MCMEVCLCMMETVEMYGCVYPFVCMRITFTDIILHSQSSHSVYHSLCVSEFLLYLVSIFIALVFVRFLSLLRAVRVYGENQEFSLSNFNCSFCLERLRQKP